ncbi:hypothetical protein P152DRAFT_462856 [Eremomyces bilateralis CBS 781.70]|uniref:Uncharacterized protein n=1 Tax=Eremomyces bilateralis CBS 781.70 TaxID=1392243 RepID=A0A6G1FQU3_9PEZI|nr:uncharacterized protein P152DRAFT_462856 [Eremomyces bilateralis CBS 781.70]KAF1808116.1 hypothetical protein P152DRAFT_462856 [Eremomyces bilateralis CBS 781.70]
MARLLANLASRPHILAMAGTRSTYPSVAGLTRVSSNLIRPQGRRAIPPLTPPAVQLTQCSGFKTASPQDLGAIPRALGAASSSQIASKFIEQKPVTKLLRDRTPWFTDVKTVAATAIFALELSKPFGQRSLEAWRAREWSTERIAQPYFSRMDELDELDDEVPQKKKQGRMKNQSEEKGQPKPRKMVKFLVIVALMGGLGGIEITISPYLKMFDQHMEEVMPQHHGGRFNHAEGQTET